MIKTSFNEGWLYWEDRSAFALVWTVPDKARKVRLPHDAMLEAPVYADSPNGRNTGFRDGGVYHYVKRFFVEESRRGRTLILHFEGIYQNASVYVNGQRAIFHPYGYTGFDVPLNPFLNYGQDNEIRVIVNNSAMTNARWYSGGGMYRDVWLLEAGASHILPFGTRLTTLSADNSEAEMQVDTELAHAGTSVLNARLETLLLHPDGTLAARESSPLTLMPGQTFTHTQALRVNQPLLWSAEHPALYTCRTLLYEGEGLLDEQEVSFGIRTLSLSLDRGLLVNGAPVKLRGACIHHDAGLLGGATYFDAEYRRVALMKQAGFNALRMAHHPASRALLEACDSLGMYVMDEAFDMWTRGKADSDYAQFFDDWWKRDIAEMARKNHNHPSVILISIGNEIPEIGTAAGALLAAEIHREYKRQDPSRLTLASVNGVFAAGDALDTILMDLRAQLKREQAADWNVNDFLSAMERHMGRIVTHPEITKRLDAAFSATDIAGYNYMTARYEADSQRHPQRFLVGSETYPGDIAESWRLVQKLPRLIGDFAWTGWDYIGEAGVGCPSYGPKDTPFGLGYPCQLAYCGDHDLLGWRRPLSYLREIVFGLRQAPYIAVQNPHEDAARLNRSPWILSDALPSWTYPCKEGQEMTVEVYAPGDEVELLLKGRSLGRLPSGAAAGYRALFRVPYEPGTLTAIAYQDGQELGRHSLETTGEARAIELRAWQGPRDGLVYADVFLKDAEGRLVTNGDIRLTATCAGGALLGFGSADPMTGDHYQSSETATFQGRAQAIFKPEGNAQITISGGGMTASLAWPDGQESKP